MMASIRRAGRSWAAAILFLALSACGLGREAEHPGVVSDPVVAATVNGRPIYIEDVRTYAVQRGLLQEGEDLNANSNAFFLALDEMIETRLFASEAESQGLDREPDIRRRLQLARERVLASAIYEELLAKASDPHAVEQAYQDNASRLGEGQEIHLRHIQFATRDAALAAKRRLDSGERFEALAFELSTDRTSAADGGDLGFRDADDLPEPIRQLADSTQIGQVGGPVRSEVGWHLIRVDDRRAKGVPSIETLRPQIVQWLLFQETQKLRERLEADARIERMREPDQGVEPGGDVTVPSDRPAAPPTQGQSPAPAAPPSADAAIGPVGPRSAPPFPFPMGPGGVYSGSAEAPASPATAPATAAPRPSSGPTPARPGSGATAARPGSGATAVQRGAAAPSQGASVATAAP